MSKKFVVANWKMNPQTVKEAEQLFEGICGGAPKSKNLEVAICPPFVYLDRLFGKIQNTKYKIQVKFGAQDAFWEKQGSYTGEVSIPMLKNFGVRYLIVGHSEERNYLNVNNEMVNKKITAALKNNLKVIFCVGEKERDEKGEYLKFIKREVIEGLAKMTKADLKNLMIAYEPIWAISSRKGAIADTPENFLQTSIYIRRVLFFRFGLKVSRGTPILYGGSVDSQNVREFFEQGRADGVLVGRASWKVKSFTDLLKKIS